MQHFTLDPSMTATFGGAFYPKGHSFVMFENADDAKATAQRLIDLGISADDVYLLPPDTVLSQISPTVSDADNPLPSAGTEGATVRAYTKLAREGHHAILVKTDDSADTEQLMEVVRQVPYSIAQRYRMLVIEDL